jgi:hypothetical protein
MSWGVLTRRLALHSRPDAAFCGLTLPRYIMFQMVGMFKM